MVILGTSGVGKTTLARSLAERKHLRHIEVDAIFHQPNWTPLDGETFLQRVSEATSTPGWVTDGNYSIVRPLLLGRADTVLWLDYARPLTTFRVVRRTLKRALVREELWNGNREAWTNLFRLDPEESIIRWSWTTHGHTRATIGELLARGDLAHCTVLRFRHPKETAAWMRGLHASPF